MCMACSGSKKHLKIDWQTFMFGRAITHLLHAGKGV